MALVDAATRCVPFASHPLGTSLYDAPVACDYSSRSCAYAPTVPSGSSQVQHSAVGGEACGFRRFAGVDNAAAARLKPSYGYGAAVVPLATPSLDACEVACCEEALCHSVVGRQGLRRLARDRARRARRRLLLAPDAERGGDDARCGCRGRGSCVPSPARAPCSTRSSLCAAAGRGAARVAEARQRGRPPSATPTARACDRRRRVCRRLADGSAGLAAGGALR